MLDALPESVLDRIVCLGVSYQTTDLAGREAAGGGIDGRCRALCDRAHPKYDAFGVQEIAWLATCHRVEVFALLRCGGDPVRASRQLTGVLDLVRPGGGWLAHEHRGRDAIRHLCRVAAGLDSMILGEPQILGQVVGAFETATAARTAGPVLSAVFRGAIRAARQARSETSIGAHPTSTGAAALALAGRVAGPVDQQRVLVIGLGEMGMTAVKALRWRRVKQIAVANRTHERAAEVAARYALRTYAMEDLADALDWADVVISSTSCPHVIVAAPLVEAVMRKRPDRSLVFVDMAVPRDIDPAVRGVSGAHLFDADDLGGALEHGVAARRGEVGAVEDIIERRLRAIEQEICELRARPLIRDLHRKAESVRRQEIENALRSMGDIDADTRERLHAVSRSLVRRLLRSPTTHTEKAARDAGWEEHARWVRQLFDL